MIEPVLRTVFESPAGLPAGRGPVCWLTPFENERAESFKVPKRRDEWLLGRRALKRLVREAAPEVLGRALSPEMFEIATEPSGAPFARLVSGERLPLSVTLSHSHGAAFCALLGAEAGEGAIGGDLEWIEPRSPGFVRDFFTPGERGLWDEAAPEERPLLANAIWSAKESVLKALGLGLRADTRDVEIRLSSERAEGPLPARKEIWRRFDAVCAAGLDTEEAPLSGLWSLRGRFVVTLAARLPSPVGKERHVRDRHERRRNDPHGRLRPRAA